MAPNMSSARNGRLRDRHDRQLCPSGIEPLGQKNQHIHIYFENRSESEGHIGSLQNGRKMGHAETGIPSSLAATASFDGSKLKVNISAAASGVIPALPSDAPFSSATFAKTGHFGQYVLALKSGSNIEGYYIEKVSDGIIVHIKRPVMASPGNRPLNGITIMLDPGHGGSDSGAIGPLGAEYPEKTINLYHALYLKSELEKRGAKVLMTRTTDVFVSLTDRLAASRDARRICSFRSTRTAWLKTLTYRR